MFSINLFFRGEAKEPPPKETAKTHNSSLELHENAQQEGAPGGRRSGGGAAGGARRRHISLSRLDYKTGQPRPQSPIPIPIPIPIPTPDHTDDVVDDVERRCIAPPKMANGDPRHWSQAEGRSPALGETGHSK